MRDGCISIVLLLLPMILLMALFAAIIAGDICNSFDIVEYSVWVWGAVFLTMITVICLTVWLIEKLDDKFNNPRRPNKTSRAKKQRSANESSRKNVEQPDDYMSPLIHWHFFYNNQHRTDDAFSPSSDNWTDTEDWQCGEQDDHDGMSGFDIYEDNDF